MKKSFLYVFLFLFSFCILCRPVSAADLILSPSTDAAAVNVPFSVSVLLSQNTEAVNAFAGTLAFPQALVSVSAVSKDNSIIKLWYAEPEYDNGSGTLHFEGVVPNPGYTDTSGKILTITFIPKQQGEASLSLTAGSVLANDGKGTEVLKRLGSAKVAVKAATVTVPALQPVPAPVPVTAAPASGAVPRLSSATHPDSSKWYANNNPSFNWNLPSDALAVRLLYDEKPVSIPTVVYEPAISTKTLNKVPDGVHYFHLQIKDKNGWGEIAHMRFQIDTVAPETFAITFPHGNDGDNPQPIIYFNTPDKLSGIDHYEVKVGEGHLLSFAPEALSNPYTLPSQSSGNHTVVVSAIDKAGNVVTQSADFSVEAIDAPKISYYPETMEEGDLLKVRGITYPNSTVNAYVTDDKGKVVSDFSKSNSLGDFSVVWSKKIDAGVYRLSLETIDSRGAVSPRSEEVAIEVTRAPLFKIGFLVVNYVSILIMILGSIAVVGGFIWYILASATALRRRIKSDLWKAEHVIEDEFNELQMEISYHIDKLTDAKGKRVLSKEEQNILKVFKKKLAQAEKNLKARVKNAEKDIG